MQIAYIGHVNKKTDKNDFLQLRIPRSQKPGAELVAKMEKIAANNGLSINDVANMAVAAGLNMVERKLTEIRDPVGEPQAA
jgi:hypothetical protein